MSFLLHNSSQYCFVQAFTKSTNNRASVGGVEISNFLCLSCFDRQSRSGEEKLSGTLATKSKFYKLKL